MALLNSFISLSLLLTSVALAQGEPNRIPPEFDRALDTYSKFEAFKLSENQLPRPSDGFHGYRVLKQKTISEPALRKAWTSRLRKKVVDDTESAVVAGCFNPRHGLRISNEKGQVIDFLICFECLKMSIFEGNNSYRVYLEESLEDWMNREIK